MMLPQSHADEDDFDGDEDGHSCWEAAMRWCDGGGLRSKTPTMKTMKLLLMFDGL